MELSVAKQSVIDAGKRLVETGLIARTWGNVSCRVNDTQFVITPSGRSYDSLTPDDIVLVNISDLSYDGDVKPSSEKGIHAQCYALRKDVNFVIHTHQYLASILSAVDKSLDSMSDEHSAILGPVVPVASYGLPGTAKLRKGVSEAIMNYPESNAIIMAHHGAVCLGSDYENAFLCSKTLEDACLDFIKKTYNEKTGRTADSFEDILNAFSIVPWESALECYTSVREGNTVRMTSANGKSVEIDLSTACATDGSETPKTAGLHCALYKSNSEIGCIIHSKKNALYAASQRLSKILLPCLDDSAQIAGIDTHLVRFKPDCEKSIGEILSASKNRNAVLLADNGAVCFSTNEDEAGAVLSVLEKNCAAAVIGRLFGGSKPIGTVDCTLMRVVYKMKYSKKKDA